MRLYEHEDFSQAVLAAAKHFEPRGLRASFIEKDYFVTEALREIARFGGDRVIFKGGTSLSKGWNLIERLSEDIDIFLDPEAHQPPLDERSIKRELKKLRDAVARFGGLKLEESKSGAMGRSDSFSFTQNHGGVGEPINRVLVESGTASGNQPTEVRRIQSYLGEFLQATSKSLGAEDEGAFEFRLLHFRRTFVEKLFAIHAKVELLKERGTALGPYARHYYDLHQLAGRSEVRAMLASKEHAAIKADYDRISRAAFPRDYRPPEGMSFAHSDALFPPAALEAQLRRNFEDQCRQLCYGKAPTWADVRASFDALRDLL